MEGFFGSYGTLRRVKVCPVWERLPRRDPGGKARKEGRRGPEAGSLGWARR
ncbi:MAG: hypothetical protein Kow0054_17470 [Deferrisoma sp.]